MQHKFIGVRHGNALPSSERTEAQKNNPPLSAKGLGQAEELKGRLVPMILEATVKGSKVKMVCSPMQRCLSTAAPSAAAAGSSILVHAGMFEYGCAGTEFPGSTIEEIQQSFVASPQPNIPLEFSHFKGASEGGGWAYHGSEAKEKPEESKKRARGAPVVTSFHSRFMGAQCYCFRARNLNLFVLCDRNDGVD